MQEERRKSNEEINNLKTEFAVFSERITNWMDTTVDYRNRLCEKIDTILKEIDSINKRCFDKTEGYVLMDEHIKDSKQLKSIWRDRNFQILLGLVSPVYLTIIGIIIRLILKHE